jgi:hypothetical protein
LHKIEKTVLKGKLAMTLRLFVPLFVVFTSGFTFAQDTAYKALRAVGKQRGESALGQIVSISGVYGHPQPTNWQVSLNDPSGRTGARELQVGSGQVLSERAARSGQRATPIDLTKLNLDSDGAFHAAEQEAARNQVSFDSANYRLFAQDASRQPIWKIELFDVNQRPVGTVRVAADTGNLIAGSNWVRGNGIASAQNRPLDIPRRRTSDQDVLAEPSPSKGAQAYQPPPPADYRQPQYQDVPRHQPADDYANDTSQPAPDNYDGRYANDSGNQEGESIKHRINRYGASVYHFGATVVHRTTNAFRKVGGWFQKRFTGEDTLSPPEQNNDSDQYNQPVQPTEPYNQPVNPSPAE